MHPTCRQEEHPKLRGAARNAGHRFDDRSRCPEGGRSNAGQEHESGGRRTSGDIPTLAQATLLRGVGTRPESCAEAALYVLCVDLGYCIPPDAAETILDAQPGDAEAFVDAVLSAELLADGTPRGSFDVLLLKSDTQRACSTRASRACNDWVYDDGCARRSLESSVLDTSGDSRSHDGEQKHPPIYRVSEADGGTRILDLLHGKDDPPCAPVRASSIARSTRTIHVGSGRGRGSGRSRRRFRLASR